MQDVQNSAFSCVSLDPALSHVVPSLLWRCSVPGADGAKRTEESQGSPLELRKCRQWLRSAPGRFAHGADRASGALSAPGTTVPAVCSAASSPPSFRPPVPDSDRAGCVSRTARARRRELSVRKLSRCPPCARRTAAVLPRHGARKGRAK